MLRVPARDGVLDRRLAGKCEACAAKGREEGKKQGICGCENCGRGRGEAV